ncbi:MAG: radical SAM protein [Desulfohalobiaceae bacterium]|nr:radical SAM protein [Desulfohalobiaceae bacterium]
MDYVGSCIRPPSEANSILLQVSLGCSHGKCTFCGSYQDKRFAVKDEQTIFSDIEFAAEHMKRQDRLFLMDGDSLILPQRKLIRILDRINARLPWVKRIGTYANAKGIRKKTAEELVQLRERKLGIIYLGVESGDDRVLSGICKGSSADTLAAMGRKVKEAGIKLSVTVLLGIGGRQRSLEHARATGELLTRMDPDYVGALTVMLIPGTPLYDNYQTGEYQLPDQRGLLLELREMLEHTDLSRGLFISNHASNYLPIKVRMPRHKQEGLEMIDRALQGSVDLKPEWLRAL